MNSVQDHVYYELVQRERAALPEAARGHAGQHVSLQLPGKLISRIFKKVLRGFSMLYT